MAKVVIIGAVAAGASAAARLRRLDEDSQITIYERGPYMSYANCGLPYFVGDVIKSKDNLLLQTTERMKKVFNVDVLVRHEVIKINKDKKEVVVKNLNTNEEFIDTYDYLLIATGSSPFIPPIPGVDSNKVLSLWTVEDSIKIKNKILDKGAKNLKVGVIGGGFIGVEMAENLQHLGCSVSLIEATAQILPQLDFAMAQVLHENLTDNGVLLYLNQAVKLFKDKDDGIEVELSSGTVLDFDLIILAIGVRANSQLAKDANLILNERQGIVVDNKLHTSCSDIFAAGDVIEVDNFVSCQKDMIPLAGPANKQGRMFADIISGFDYSYEGSQGTSVLKVFDYHVASSGLSKKRLEQLGKKENEDFCEILITQNSHASYYPGASALYLKLIFDLKDYRILGIQVIGREGVDKRVDVVATVMRLKGSVFDLKKLELCYAPPFSGAKDPVNMLGFVAENVINKLIHFAPLDFKNVMNNYLILDVREEAELLALSIDGALNIPLGQLRQNLDKLDKEKNIIIFCAVGVRAYNAARILMNHGFKNVYVYPAGVKFYKTINKDYSLYEKKTVNNSQDPTNVALKQVVDVTNKDNFVVDLDCTALQCPGPLMLISKTLNDLKEGQRVKATASDLGFYKDVKAFCKNTGNELISLEKKDGAIIAVIEKSLKSNNIKETLSLKDETIVVFSGDLDKVMAAFIIANGAAAMGKKVTMFFTFWGLNALRKENLVATDKTFLEKMFSFMMPRGSNKLTLSKMNMGGIGTYLLKKIMKDKNVASLDTLIEKARDNGINLVACTMTMDIMGIKKEELIDGVELGGVASYLDAASKANHNLFI